MFKSKNILKFLILFICICFLKANGNDNYVIIVSFDGFRYDYINFVDTPNFDYLKKNGIKAKSLKPIFPTLTFPNHYSIATGCYSEKHGIIGNEFYDVSKNTLYTYTDSNTVRNGIWYLSEPIWVTANKNNISTAIYHWVGSEAEIMGYRPNIYKKYKNGINSYSKVDSAMKWLNLPEIERPKLIMLYFNEPDHTGHIYGPLADETLTEVQGADNILGYLIKSINRLNIKNNINLIVVSDHGMSSVSKENLINLDNYINKDILRIEGKGTMVKLRFEDDLIFSQCGEEFSRSTVLMNSGRLSIDTYTHNKYNELREKWNDCTNSLKVNGLSANYLNHITLYDRYSIPQRLHFNNYNSPDFLLVAEEGYLMYNKESLADSYFDLKGMHGYDPDNINMHGIFFAYGPSFKENIIIDTFELIHIYPLLCKILNIESHSNIDGDINILKSIIN